MESELSESTMCGAVSHCARRQFRPCCCCLHHQHCLPHRCCCSQLEQAFALVRAEIDFGVSERRGFGTRRDAEQRRAAGLPDRNVRRTLR